MGVEHKHKLSSSHHFRAPLFRQIHVHDISSWLVCKCVLHGLKVCAENSTVYTRHTRTRPTMKVLKRGSGAATFCGRDDHRKGGKSDRREGDAESV